MKESTAFYGCMLRKIKYDNDADDDDDDQVYKAKSRYLSNSGSIQSNEM